MEKELFALKDTRLTVEMSTEQKEKIRKYAKKNRVTMSVAVRMILSEALAGDLQKKQVPSREDVA